MHRSIILWALTTIGCATEKSETSPTEPMNSSITDNDEDSDADADADADSDTDADADADADSDADSDADTDADSDADSDADADADVDEDIPLEGYGDITGDCGVIDLPTSSGHLYRNAVDFGDTPFDEGLVSSGGLEILEDGTLGGSSIYSELTAFELLHRCEIAFLLKTETEIEYRDESGKKTDMLIEVDLEPVGVSVTRAFHWPPDSPYTEEEAYELLDDKLNDVLLSAANAADSNRWAYAILHVIAYDSDYADRIEDAYSTLPESLTNETILVLTVTDGNDDFVY